MGWGVVKIPPTPRVSDATVDKPPRNKQGLNMPHKLTCAYQRGGGKYSPAA